MSFITSTLDAQKEMLVSFLGMVLRDGLPEQFFYRVMRDSNLRSDFIAWAKGRLNESNGSVS